jgi:hypothetical protein
VDGGVLRGDLRRDRLRVARVAHRASLGTMGARELLVRRGEIRFTIRVAMLCAATFIAAAFLALVLNRLAYMVFMGI